MDLRLLPSRQATRRLSAGFTLIAPNAASLSRLLSYVSADDGGGVCSKSCQILWLLIGETTGCRYQTVHFVERTESGCSLPPPCWQEPELQVQTEPFLWTRPVWFRLREQHLVQTWDALTCWLTRTTSGSDRWCWSSSRWMGWCSEPDF